MGEFNASSKFRLNLVHEDGDTDRVSVQIGLDGLIIKDVNSGRTTRSYELGHISRWQSRGNSLVLYTRTPTDVEEHQLTLQGDEYTVRGALDTLTCCCLQLAELLQSKQSQNDQETANNLHALVSGNGKKKTKTHLPSADDVEYWRNPDKAGWLQSQADYLKTWRKRWFVLKQGFLFRFINDKVSESVKPRGVVDLSKVQDVKPGSTVTGKANSIQLKTSSGGSVAYVCDTETEMVEWISALDGSIQKIVKTLAGVEDEPAPKVSTKKSSSANPSNEWIKQLEKNFDNLTTTSSNTRGHSHSHSRNNAGGSSSRDDYGGRSGRDDYGGSSGRDNYGRSSRDDYGSRSGRDGPAMVEVVGYDNVGGGGGLSQRGGGGGGDSYRAGGGGGGSSGLGYGSIAGVAGALSADTMANYTDYGRSDRAGSSQLQYQGSGGSGYSQGQGGYGGAAYGNGGSYSAAIPPSAYGLGAYGAPVISQPQQQQPQAPVPSLIDSVPQSQPAYPYYQTGMAAPQASSAPPQAPPSTWQVHYTGEGKPYYYNTATGVTQWEAPPGM